MNLSKNTDPNLCRKQVKHYESLQPMEFDIYKVSIDCLEKSFNQACTELQGYPKSSMGLTLNKDNRWRELRQVKAIYQKGIQKLNRMIPKSYLVRLRDERRGKQL
tara:strand:+ start:133 stop:447 length:315 start_codon:yes stop_codon:yes gene_type:complete